MDQRRSEGEMAEVVPNLWLGDIRDALDAQTLRQKNIHSVLSAMRGTVKIEQVCPCLVLANRPTLIIHSK